jgi:O-antigen/teichoic acid export membrane protein
MGARAILMILQFLSIPILARLLTVEDFAIVALGMTIPMFANAFSDAGFGRSLIRTPKYDETEWSSVFWFLVAVGVCLALLVILIAPLYARLTGRPELFSVIMVLALVPMIQSVMSVHQASIERSYRFDLISNITATAGILSVGAALGLAFLGFGYWALVIQQVLLATIRMLGVLWHSPFQAKTVFRASLLRPHLNFGRNTLLFSIIMTFQNQTPILAFNQVFGTLAVSLWSMSERISRLPRLGAVGPLAQVTMVSMSRQWRDGEGAADVGRTYVSGTRLLATLLFPALLVLAFNGRPAFTWLLSEPWGDVALIFGLAIPGLLVDMLSSLGARVFMVADRTDLRLRMSIERFALGIIFFLAALPLGLEIAVLARSLFAVAYLPRYWTYLNQCVPLTIRAEIGPLVLPTSIGLLAGALSAVFIAPLISSPGLETLVLLGQCIFAIALTSSLTWRALQRDIEWLRNSAKKAS